LPRLQPVQIGEVRFRDSEGAIVLSELSKNLWPKFRPYNLDRTITRGHSENNQPDHANPNTPFARSAIATTMLFHLQARLNVRSPYERHQGPERRKTGQQRTLFPRLPRLALAAAFQQGDSGI
jgi:hypothetical protein